MCHNSTGLDLKNNHEVHTLDLTTNFPTISILNSNFSGPSINRGCDSLFP